jgi:hypothetical protein
MAFAILRTEKLKTMGEIGGSLAHTFRTRETANADPSRTRQNEHSLESPDAVKDAISDRLPEKIRKNGVLCVEHLITASPEWKGWGTDQEKRFFEESKKWLEDRYGKQNVVATSIHRDETTPHLVAYVVPLDPDTGRLNARKWLGGKAVLSQMQTDFAEQVRGLGLERGIEGSKAEHTTIRDYYTKVNEPVPQVKGIDRPKAKVFETTAQYGDRVVQDVLEQIKPQWQGMATLSKEVKTARKNALEAHKTLETLQEQVKPYLDAIRPLNAKEKRILHDVMNNTCEKLQEKRLEAERQRKIQQENAKKDRWTKIYDTLTPDQKIKTDFLMDMIKKQFENDSAMLNRKMDEAQNKIGANPAALDKVPMPQTKGHQVQDEVQRTKSRSGMSR